MYALLRDISVIKMTTERLKVTIDYFFAYAKAAGQHLSEKFANDYEVSELVSTVEDFSSFEGSGKFIRYLTEEEKKELFNAFKITIFEEGSQFRLFSAAMTVAYSIRQLEGIRDGDKYKAQKIEPTSACAYAPFLAKACEYLEVLKKEICPHLADFNLDVTQVGVCAGEDLTEF